MEPGARSPSRIAPILLVLVTGLGASVVHGMGLVVRLGRLGHYAPRADRYLAELRLAAIWAVPLALAGGWLLASSPRVRRWMAELHRRVELLPERVAAMVLLGAFLGGAAVTARFVIGGIPRVFDGYNYYWQARCFAEGFLAAPIPEPAELFRFPFVMMEHGGWYGSVYPGYPAFLALGLLLGASWLASPILGALALRETWLLGRTVLPGRSGLWALFLGAASPMWIMMSAIHMSHAAAAFLCLAGVRHLWRAAQAGCFRSGWLAGLFLGLGLLTRPQAVVPVAGPFLLWWTVRLIRRRSRMAPGLAALLLILLAQGANLAYNRAITGDAWLNPRYQVSPYRRLGFGPDVGEPLPGGGLTGHTVGRGLENTRTNLSLLNAELLGWPTALAAGPLTLLALWGAFGPGRRAPEVLMGTAWLANIGLYIGYFTASPNFGPRYFAESAPLVLLLAVRGLQRMGGAEAGSQDWCRIRLAVLLLSLLGLAGVRPAHLAHYGWLPEALSRRLVPSPEGPAVVTLPPQLFLTGACLWNDPALTGPVLWVPQRRSPPLADPALAELMANHPDRRLYRFDHAGAGRTGRLIPVEVER